MFISWADGGVARAGFLWITIARALAADGARACILAVAAAIFVGVVTDRVVLVSASRGVTAWVVTTALLTTAVTLFVALHDAVTTLLASDGLHISVIAQTISPDIVVLDSTADVADRAGRELVNTSLTRRIHDVPLIGIASVCIQWTALRSHSRVCGGTSLRIAIMHSAEGVARLMRNDLPLHSTIGAINNVGSGNSFSSSTAIRLASASGRRVRLHSLIYAGLA